MADDTILCWRTQATVGQVKSWLAAGEARDIGEFIWNRFDERYFAPFKPLSITERNGFTIMAVSCLVIEALEAFHRGWESSRNKSELAFCSFFDREIEFHSFKGYSRQFYQHVRCGILHQAETTGGWTITLVPRKPLFDAHNLRVQADEFHAALSRSLKKYTEAVKNADLSDSIWKNCANKLTAILKNCS